jgi:rhamnosyltransferase
MNKIAGTVILYHPDRKVLPNINSYLDQVDKLYIIDNSSVISEFVQQEFQSNEKVVYAVNNQNIGIASALNMALLKAEEDGYEFLLTMDQDSYFEGNVINKMVARIIKDENIGLVSARHQHLIGKNESEQNISEVDRLVAMTSGNIVRVKLFRNIGGYKEDLFIDYVDHEICLRLNTLGFKVEILDDCKIIHSLGNVIEKKFLWRKIYPTNHLPIRLYYQTRNRFYVYKIYGKNFPEYVKLEKINFIKTILKVLLFENAKWQKIKFMFYGYRDYIKNNYGKYYVNANLLIIGIMILFF